jgi:hypothetical protein
LSTGGLSPRWTGSRRYPRPQHPTRLPLLSLTPNSTARPLPVSKVQIDVQQVIVDELEARKRPLLVEQAQLLKATERLAEITEMLAELDGIQLQAKANVDSLKGVPDPVPVGKG